MVQTSRRLAGSTDKMISEIVEDYLDAEGFTYSLEVRDEPWGRQAIVFHLKLRQGRTVRIDTYDRSYSEIRIVVGDGERTIPESFVNVTAGSPALIQSIVRAAIGRY